MIKFVTIDDLGDLNEVQKDDNSIIEEFSKSDEGYISIEEARKETEKKHSRPNVKN